MCLSSDDPTIEALLRAGISKRRLGARVQTKSQLEPMLICKRLVGEGHRMNRITYCCSRVVVEVVGDNSLLVIIDPPGWLMLVAVFWAILKEALAKAIAPSCALSEPHATELIQ